MTPKINRHVIILSLFGLLILELLFSFSHWLLWLEKMAYTGEALTGIVAASALISFIYQVNRDNNIYATELVGFFREKILVEKGRLVKEINDVNGKPFNFEEQHVKMDVFELWWLQLHHKETADRQHELFVKGEKIQLIYKAMNFFNLLEEFSLKVKYMGLINHPALISVKQSFIMSIEENSVVFLAYLFTNKDSYPGIKVLYEKWKNDCDRRPEKEKREAMFREIRSKVQEEKKKIESEKMV